MKLLLALLLPAMVCAAPFTENGGVVIFEAEDFETKIDRNGHAWTFSNAVTGFSGTGYMEASPNNGTNNNATWVSTSPELQYAVSFPSAGTRYVWIRGHATNGGDDSVHAGWTGTTNTAAHMTLVSSQYGNWAWFTNRVGVTGVPTISVSAPGTNTFNLWMREDGMRVDRVLLTTNPNFLPTTGNSFHIPVVIEGDIGVTMRHPLTTIFSNTPVTFYTGNQFQGSGNPGNQLTTGSAIFFRHITNATWSSLPMAHFKDGVSNPNNKYHSVTIPGNTFNAGDVVQYYFRIPYSDHLPTFIYGNDGQRFTTELESVAQASPFTFTVLEPLPQRTASPEDWRDESIYFVFTDRFYDGDPGNNTANPDGTFAPAVGNRIHGGDFKGIQQKLDYIKSLGATAIWILPIVRNTDGQYHGYSGWDFYSVDPHWGTFEDLTNMVAAAHARGIRVILDVVTNHGGRLLTSNDAGYPAFKAPPDGYNLFFTNSAKTYPPPFHTNAIVPTVASLFHTNGWTQDFNSDQQVQLGSLRGLDDFRTETTHIRTNMAAIYKFWIQAADLDGFRIDTVKHVEMGFWRFWCGEIRQHAAALGKSNFFMFGEALDSSEAKVGSYTGTQSGSAYALDSVLDYAMWFKIYDVFANATGNTKQIEDHYNAIAGNYHPDAHDRLVTFLDNHDQRRFLNVNNNTNRLAVALAWLYTARGIPCLYYGTEQAFNGGHDPNNREDMWHGQFEQGPSLGDNFNMTHPLFQLVAKLNNFRRLYPSLRRGVHRNLWNNPTGPGLFAYARTNATEEVFVVFNTAGSAQTLPSRPTTYLAGATLVNLLDTNETVTLTQNNQTPAINVPGTTAKLFIAQSLLKPLDPVVVSQSPAHAVTNVSTTAPITLTFSKPMDTNSAQAAFSAGVAGTFTWAGTTAVTFHATGGLPGLTTNIVRVSTNAMDAVSSNKFHAAFETFFVTAESVITDTTPPTATILMPVNGATLAGDFNINGLASDDIAVDRVEFRLDNGNWIPATGTSPWSHTLDTRNFLNGSHLIAARAFDTSGNVSAQDSVVVRFFNVPGHYEQRLSAGHAHNATNCDASVWIKDQAYSFGAFGYAGGSTNFIGNTIATCPEAQSLYRHERLGGFRYLFDCPAGLYETTVLNAETFWTGPNQRVFDVFIEGEQVLTNFDIFAEAGGQNIPVTLQFTNAVADAQLEVQFTPLTDNPRVSGIAVRRLGDVDTDGDGIPDWWMLGHFNHPTGQDADFSLAGDDPDGDGFTNLEEFLAGFDPLDAASALRITKIERIGDDIEVSWLSAAGKTNQLLRANAPGGAWENVGSTTPGTGGIVTQSDPGAATNAVEQYYRVRLVQ